MLLSYAVKTILVLPGVAIVDDLLEVNKVEVNEVGENGEKALEVGKARRVVKDPGGWSS